MSPIPTIFPLDICRRLPHQQAPRFRVNLSTQTTQLRLRPEICLREGLKHPVLSTTATLPTKMCRPVCEQEFNPDSTMPALQVNPCTDRCSSPQCTPCHSPRLLLVGTRDPVLEGPASHHPTMDGELPRTMTRSSMAISCPQVLGLVDNRRRVPGHSRPIHSPTSPTVAMALSSRTRQTPPTSHPVRPNLCLSPWRRRRDTICRQTPKWPLLSQSNAELRPHLWLPTAICPRAATFLVEAACHLQATCLLRTAFLLETACLLQRTNSPP